MLACGMVLERLLGASVRCRPVGLLRLLLTPKAYVSWLLVLQGLPVCASGIAPSSRSVMLTDPEAKFEFNNNTLVM